ncbi:hypothetical protein DERF_009129 [Dermatophagoides farinae]|uniref:Uncharacterized protein n=1 Tax=Dermatophagoides farinae TaxID=6954 RepID=A0A922L5D0_DERFA|nr:hypothetical protein DERF_009129 [Dermatophagoides farinae]
MFSIILPNARQFAVISTSSKLSCLYKDFRQHTDKTLYQSAAMNVLKKSSSKVDPDIKYPKSWNLSVSIVLAVNNAN